KRDEAVSSILVGAGDTCDTLASKCGIATTELEAYSTDFSLCTSLQDGKPICCSVGTLELPPRQGSNGSISQGYVTTIDELESYNKATYAWCGCDELVLGGFMCLSSGTIPMPVAIPQAFCGPQVPGTARPDNMSDLSSLNPFLSQDEKLLRSRQCLHNKTRQRILHRPHIQPRPRPRIKLQQPNPPLQAQKHHRIIHLPPYGLPLSTAKVTVKAIIMCYKAQTRTSAGGTYQPTPPIPSPGAGGTQMEGCLGQAAIRATQQRLAYFGSQKPNAQSIIIMTAILLEIPGYWGLNVA
ncbi:glycoside hydrolase family 18 protein, partial [Penicillium angulare]|uniref:glycoside hydrolase family 18 protein n=1 Tax=Penicillium angulare TaxID=116970 RepID=UPI0025403E5E